jgi:hypothetical protein
MYLYVNSTTNGFPKKTIKTFPMHLELRISPQIFEKNENGPNGILRGLGETDS